jgi:hypothetical protein
MSGRTFRLSIVFSMPVKRSTNYGNHAPYLSSIAKELEPFIASFQQSVLSLPFHSVTESPAYVENRVSRSHPN